MSLRRLAVLFAAAALVPVALQAAPKSKSPQSPPPNLPKMGVGGVVAEKPLPTPAESDWLTPNPDALLVIDTDKGRIVVEMYPDIAPATVAQIQALAKKHFYDGQNFFRVIEDFMDQTGDPQNNGQGGSDLPNVKGEFTFMRTAATPFYKATDRSGLEVGFVHAMPTTSQSEDLMAMTAKGQVKAWGLFCAGTAGMARAGDPDSANSQFFLMRGLSTSLEQKYTPWGRVLTGLDIVKAIKVGEPPEDPQDKMLTVRLASDMPEADRPKVQVLDTRSSAFKVQVDRALDRGGFNVCDVTVPTRTPGAKS